MKSPGVIYRQYRLLRRNRLAKEVEAATKRCPQNCHYWKELSLPDERGKNYKVPMCFLRQETGKPLNPKLLTICSTVENAQKCNAFTPKHRREDIEKRFTADLANPSIAHAKYPELASLEWVLDKSLHEARQNPTIFTRVIVYGLITLEKLLKALTGPRPIQ